MYIIQYIIVNYKNDFIAAISIYDSLKFTKPFIALDIRKLIYYLIYR